MAKVVRRCSICDGAMKTITYANMRGERRLQGWCARCDGPAARPEPDEASKLAQFRKEFNL